MSEILELGTIFVFLLVGFMLAMRVKLPPAIAILLIGAIIGPFALGLVKGGSVINAFSEIGAILLLFVIGIEFSLSKIMQFGMRALLLAFIKLTFVFVLIYEIALAFGLGPFNSLLIGILFMFSSTTVFSKLVNEYESSNKNDVNLLFAVLILEDILAVFAITTLSAMPISVTAATAQKEIVFSIVKSLAALLICYIVLQKIVKLLFHYFAASRTTETLLFASLSVLAIFVFLATFFGFDASIGAFLAGSVMAALREFKIIERTILPFGLFFSSFFFLSMGMMVNPAALYTNLLLLVIFFFVNLLSKFLSVGLSIYLLNSNTRSAVFSAISMLTIGEFSLLIAKTVQPVVDFDIIGVTSASVFLSILASALLMKHVKEINYLVISTVPMAMRNNSRKISAYINTALMEFEPKGRFFRLFTTEIQKLLIYVLSLILFNGLLFIIEVWLETVEIASFATMPLSAIRIAVHLLLSLGLLWKMLGSFDKILNGIANTFRKIDKKNIELDKRLVYDVVTIFFLLGISAFLPVLFSLMQLPHFFNYMIIVPMLICLVFVWDALATTLQIVKSRIKGHIHYHKKASRRFVVF